MLTKFLEDAGGHLSERWITTVLGPAFVFWGTGALALIYQYGWSQITKWPVLISPQPSEVTKWSVLIGGMLLIILISTFLPKPFELRLLRFLEGYWPSWLRRFAEWRVERQNPRIERMNERFQELGTMKLDEKLKESGKKLADKKHALSYWKGQLEKEKQKRAIKKTEANNKWRALAAARFVHSCRLPLAQTMLKFVVGSDWQKQAEDYYLALAEGNPVPTLDEIKAEGAKEISAINQQAQTIQSNILDTQKLVEQLFRESREYARKRAELTKTEQKLKQIPSDILRMPTNLGNILRAAESRPGQRYGLDALTCWPRLWLLLTENVKKDLAEARSDLDTVVRVCFWGLLSIAIWTYFAWWAAPLGLMIVLLSYRWMWVPAETYGLLLESTFDVYRPNLYQALRIRLPKDPDDERAQGALIMDYLWRVPVQGVKTPTFTQPNAKEDTDINNQPAAVRERGKMQATEITDERNAMADAPDAAVKDSATSTNNEEKRARRILLIANKRWEADPLMAVLLEKKVHLKSVPWPAELNIKAPPPENTVPETIPRALISIEDTQTKVQAEVEFWCLEDLMNTAISSSSTKEKVRVLKNIFAWQNKKTPDFVIAFGTAAYPGETSHNGCVVLGGGVFIHDPRRDDPEDLHWHDPRTDNLVPTTLPTNFFAPKKSEFRVIDETLRAQVELCMIPSPINPAEKQTLLAAYNYTSVGVINITNYDDYAWADHEALRAFYHIQQEKKQKSSPVGSIETTHGVIRLQSEAPFLFVSAITDRLGHFNLEVTSRPYSQNFVCAHNAGVVAALLLPRIARYVNTLA